MRAYLEAEQAAREKAAQQRAVLAQRRRMMEADEDEESDSDSEGSSDEDEDGGIGGGGALQPAGARGFAEPGSGPLGRKRGHGVAFDESGRGGRAGLEQDETDAADGLSTRVSFDIYLKGNASRATSFFGAKANAPGSAGQYGAGVRFRMFPFVERKRRVDGYGEVIDVARWLSRRRELEATAETEAEGEEAREAKRRKTQADRERAKAATPSKFVSERLALRLECQVAFIDLEGLNDGRALKTLVPQLHPRRLILVNADRATSKDMLASLNAVRSMTRECHAPALGVPVRIGELTNAFTVSLGEGLLASLHLSRFEDYEVAHLRARIRLAQESTIPTLEPLSGATIAPLPGAAQPQAEEKSAQSDALVPSTAPSQTQGHFQAIVPTLFIGDLKLSTLRATLASQHGVTSELAGEGLLVCGTSGASNSAGGGGGAGAGATVTVKKEGQGRIVIEGNVGRGYYEVRKAVYGLHAQVSGQ